MKTNPVEHINIQKFSNGLLTDSTDSVAVEEPLEIQLSFSTHKGRLVKNVAVTMRTPGNDEELAVGFLFTEGVIMDKAEIQTVRASKADENQIQVTMNKGILPVLKNIERNFYSTSSCGVCGKSSMDAIRVDQHFSTAPDTISIKADVFFHLQDTLGKHQQLFGLTGGIHASALFTAEGEFILLREDVGRHNALDKVVGNALLNDQLPLNNCILLLSGRASFELIQKAAMAGIRIICAVGAPSSLAVDMAKEMDISLIGFLRDRRFNIYSGSGRIIV
jgi:FdhD protein